MQGVRVLLECDCLAVFYSPDVRDLCVLWFARRYVGAQVSSGGDDRVTCVDDLVYLHSKAIPFTAATGKDAVQDCFWTVVRIAVGVGKVLGFIPDDVRTEAPEDRWDVPLGKGSRISLTSWAFGDMGGGDSC